MNDYEGKSLTLNDQPAGLDLDRQLRCESNKVQYVLQLGS